MLVITGGGITALVFLGFIIMSSTQSHLIFFMLTNHSIEGNLGQCVAE